MHGCYGWHTGGMGLWWIVIAVALVGVIWFVITTTRRGREDSGESPEQTLKRRYAKGELDRETYERMLADLRS